MSVEALKTEYVPKYLAGGEAKLYRYLLMVALNKLISIEKVAYKGISPELEFMNCYDQFIILYRREGDNIYLDLARIFRRVAHKIYRVLLKKELIQPNNRFLNVVK